MGGAVTAPRRARLLVSGAAAVATAVLLALLTAALTERREGSDEQTRELDYLLLDASFFRYHAGAAAEPVLAAWGDHHRGRRAPVFGNGPRRFVLTRPWP